ncbi:Zinc finger, CCCH-type [Heracleum sosnowskyi]|uniref:Zinc finger, CCCH-type n=1 Tax=Heracleum sosnowskyi TaxID=360622 RepID=A0AAD8LXX1_9APIA|nr:Zinc finger, CCCH-type [Heracleum sosnowskyi]
MYCYAESSNHDYFAFMQTKANHSNECKICSRPFSVFRWRPGCGARFKKTEIFQTCSTLKTACQVCILDLQYGLPVQVIETALSINSSGSIPKSDVNREFFAEEHDRMAIAGLDYESSYGKVCPNDTILKLQRTTPFYMRNLITLSPPYVLLLLISVVEISECGETDNAHFLL